MGLNKGLTMTSRKGHAVIGQLNSQSKLVTRIFLFRLVLLILLKL